MNRLFLLTILLGLQTIALGALSGHYSGAPHVNNYLGAPRQYAAAPHRAPPAHYSAPPAHYSGARHYGAPHAAAPLRYNAPEPYSVHNSYSAPSHYAGPKRSVYSQPPPPPSYRNQVPSSNYHQDPHANTQGREMKYTIRDPKSQGMTHVTETHVVSNKEMHGAEAEAAMKKLMGSMGPSYGPNGGFQDFVKGMGLGFY